MKCARQECDKETKKVGGVSRVYCSPECARKGNNFSRMPKKAEKK